MTTEGVAPHYAGFWIRLAATIVDTLLLIVVLLPLFVLLIYIYGPNTLSANTWAAKLTNILISYVFPIIITLLFWKYRSATPGKILFNLRIVDINTLQRPTTGQLILRYIGYFISTFPLCLGFLWIAFDPRKQGWHDKIAKTAVIHAR